MFSFNLLQTCNQSIFYKYGLAIAMRVWLVTALLLAVLASPLFTQPEVLEDVEANELLNTIANYSFTQHGLDRRR